MDYNKPTKEKPIRFISPEHASGGFGGELSLMLYLLTAIVTLTM